jgi:hypothetical protein
MSGKSEASAIYARLSAIDRESAATTDPEKKEKLKAEADELNRPLREKQKKGDPGKGFAFGDAVYTGKGRRTRASRTRKGGKRAKRTTRRSRRMYN